MRGDKQFLLIYGYSVLHYWWCLIFSVL